ncbi:hypothetical protein DFQ26_002894 [Actinomortierella ambigua]|nr:hypothetical protein DFQ26_002894 [Actinomortierella ambigua]
MVKSKHPVSMVKPKHPFSSARLPNTFYFVRTHPDRYDPTDYFRTFSGLKPADKGKMHRHWTTAIQILLDSPVQKFNDNGGRLQARWKLRDRGLEAFWSGIEEAESASDVLKASSENIRKRSLRSAERNILSAIDDIDDTSGKENEKTQTDSIDESKAPRYETQDAEGRHASVQGVGLHSVQDDVRAQDEKGDSNENDDVQREGGGASQEDAQADCEELLSQKTTESECELSRSVFYLTGNGSVDCSEALWTPWLVNQKDLAPKLVVSHIYLFEKNDSTSSLFTVVGAQDWATVTASTMEQLMDDSTLVGLQTLSIKISHLSHPEAEERILDWTGPRDIKKTLAGLLADDFLWSRPPFNEHELLSHIFDPLIKSFICNVDSTMLMKDSLDDMHTQGIGASKIEVIGLVVAGPEGRFYTMRLEARGIYVMRLLSVVYAPRSQYDFSVLASTINTLMNVRARLQRTISDITSSEGEALDLTRPGFHTPTRVYKA